MEQLCGNCRFWLKNEENDDGGCRLFPPTLVYDPSVEQVLTAIPQTRADYWCGQFDAWNNK